MKFLLPLLMLVIGTGAGFGTGMALRPDATLAAVKADPETGIPETAGKAAAPGGDKGQVEYLKINNQFVVPIVRDGDVAALVVLGLSVEVAEGSKEMVYANEPKLRDAFLQVLFDHANAGGFDGAFTEVATLNVLRQALLEAGQKTVNAEVVRDVLIQEIARQDY